MSRNAVSCYCDKRIFTFMHDYGIHPTLHVYGHAYGEPSTGPANQVELVTQYFVSDKDDSIWVWEEQDWRQMPNWLEYCDVPESICAQARR